MTNNGFRTWLRRHIYNRWFYLFLALVCALDAAVDAVDMVAHGSLLALDVISLASSLVAAVMTGAIFLDLLFRRERSGQ